MLTVEYFEIANSAAADCANRNQKVFTISLCCFLIQGAFQIVRELLVDVFMPIKKRLK